METIRALVWKESRPLLPWALMAMLGTGLALALVMATLASNGFVSDGEPGVLAEEVKIVTAFAAAAAGLLLGVLCMAFELPPDRWALLVHRPVSRSRLFAAKIIAAVGLYLLATLTPFGVLTLWTSIAGNVAGPFYWRMTLPGLMAIFCGLAFLLAAMVTVRREARWLGSRILPLAVPALLLVMFIGVEQWWLNFWGLLSVCIVGVVMLLAAAWAIFVADGQGVRILRVGRLPLGFVMLVGVFMAGMIATAMVAIFVPSGSYVSMDYFLTSHGDLWKQTWQDGHLARVMNMEDQWPAELGCAPPTSMTYDDLRDWRSASATLVWRQFSEPWRAQRYYRRYRRANPMFCGLSEYSGERWYYLMDERRLVGYRSDRQSRGLIGTMGPDGFTPAGHGKARPFDEPAIAFPRGPGVMATKNRVYQVSYVAPRTCEPIWQAGEGQQIIDAQPFVMDDKGFPFPTVVLLSDALMVLGRDGEQLLTMRLAYPPDSFQRIEVARLNDGRFTVWYRSRGVALPPDHVLPTDHLLYYDGETGELLDAIDHPAWVTYRTTPIYRTIAEHIQMPPVLVPIRRVVTVIRGEQSQQHDEPSPWLVLTVFWGLASALVNGLIARRWALGRWRTALWAAFGLLLGVWGVLWMLCMVERPAWEMCGGCGRRRVVTRELCEHCGQPFAPLPRSGTEVFA
jgi:hypothetical protein